MMTKTKKCFKCGRRRARSSFYAHPEMADGLLGKCKDCTKNDVMQSYYLNHEKRREYERKRRKRKDLLERVAEYQRRSRKKNRSKWIARSRLRYAVKTGKIVPIPCAVCGATKAEAHHADYSKPLEVVWLCFKHHREAHGQIA